MSVDDLRAVALARRVPRPARRRRCSALLLGVPTLRLRADYLAIVTIAAGEIIRLVRAAPLVPRRSPAARTASRLRRRLLRPQPVRRAARYGIWRPRVQTTAADRGCCSSAGRSSLLASLLVCLLIRSPWGRVLKAIREDEDAVRSLGKNVYCYKMQSLILGGVLGALGGMLFALGRQSVQPDNYSTAAHLLRLRGLDPRRRGARSRARSSAR